MKHFAFMIFRLQILVDAYLNVQVHDWVYLRR